MFAENINFHSPMIINIAGIGSFHKAFKSIGVKEYFEMQFRQKIKEAKIKSIKSITNSFEV